jgi:hypothetical protein
MDEDGFRAFLKKAGKKENVIQGLVDHVRRFESYLRERRQAGLDTASQEDLLAYSDSLEPGRVSQSVRGLGLYYRYTGNTALARLASEIREQKIAGKRKAFRLGDFRGVDLRDIARLEARGIITVEDILAAGNTPQRRSELARQTGVASEAILELVKLSDLSRMEGVKGVRARLYYDAGLDTPEKFTHWDPRALRGMLLEWVKRTGFEGIAPLPKEIGNAVEIAHRLPKVVEYEA